jgi:hypothetical protein
MMPWYAWIYLLLLALIGAGGFVSMLRARRPVWRALVHVATIVVFAYGVVLYFRRGDAGTAFAFALFVATLLQAQKGVADAHEMRVRPMTTASRVGVALGALTLLPAIALGALAIWRQQGV